MSAKEWRLHCQIPHTETSSYLRTSRATFIFDALRRTGWAGGFEPLHLEIRSAELHPASTGSSRRRSGAPFNSRCASSSPAPGLRVLANSDSNMQRFDPAAPTGESVSNAYGIGSRSKCHEMRRFVSSAERVGKYLVQLATRLSQPVSPSGSSARRRQCIARLQATSPRGVRACIRRVAGCATSTSFASHASTEAGLELTLHLDHPMGSHQLLNLKCSLRV